jgi:hypothetical protein
MRSARLTGRSRPSQQASRPRRARRDRGRQAERLARHALGGGALAGREPAGGRARSRSRGCCRRPAARARAWHRPARRCRACTSRRACSTSASPAGDSSAAAAARARAPAGARRACCAPPPVRARAPVTRGTGTGPRRARSRRSRADRPASKGQEAQPDSSNAEQQRRQAGCATSPGRPSIVAQHSPQPSDPCSAGIVLGAVHVRRHAAALGVERRRPRAPARSTVSAQAAPASRPGVVLDSTSTRPSADEGRNSLAPTPP